MTKTVAVVEDEVALAEVLQYNLERSGFAVQVYGRGDEAWEGMQASPPDVIVLDLMLPGLDGLEVTRLIRRHDHLSGVPILMLTAKAEEIDRIVGLELGADDYITKPFSPREVVLRVKAVLRRTGPPEAASQDGEGSREWLEAGEIRLDSDGHRTLVGGEEVYLTPTEFNLLRVLLERAGRTQTRGGLLSEVWGYADDVDSRTVDTHIRRLRKKLGGEASRIETVIGVGYKLKR